MRFLFFPFFFSFFNYPMALSPQSKMHPASLDSSPPYCVRGPSSLIFFRNVELTSLPIFTPTNSLSLCSPPSTSNLHCDQPSKHGYSTSVLGYCEGWRSLPLARRHPLSERPGHRCDSGLLAVVEDLRLQCQRNPHPTRL